jgi:hypothetical protein
MTDDGRILFQDVQNLAAKLHELADSVAYQGQQTVRALEYLEKKTRNTQLLSGPMLGASLC